MQDKYTEEGELFPWIKQGLAIVVNETYSHQHKNNSEVENLGQNEASELMSSAMRDVFVVEKAVIV